MTSSQLQSQVNAIWGRVDLTTALRRTSDSRGGPNYSALTAAWAMLTDSDRSIYLAAHGLCQTASDERVAGPIPPGNRLKYKAAQVTRRLWALLWVGPTFDQLPSRVKRRFKAHEIYRPADFLLGKLHIFQTLEWTPADFTAISAWAERDGSPDIVGLIKAQAESGASQAVAA